MHKQKKTATKELPSNISSKTSVGVGGDGAGGGGGVKSVLLISNLTLYSDAAPN